MGDWNSMLNTPKLCQKYEITIQFGIACLTPQTMSKVWDNNALKL
jgi:hypothetical protein